MKDGFYDRDVGENERSIGIMERQWERTEKKIGHRGPVLIYIFRDRLALRSRATNKP